MAAKGTRTPFTAVGVLNGATAVDLVDPTATGTVYVTHVVLSIRTHANGKLAAVQDNANTPYVVANHIDATAAGGVASAVVWHFSDFGHLGGGVPCTLGKKLQAVSEASGVAGFFYVEGYTMIP